MNVLAYLVPMALLLGLTGLRQKGLERRDVVVPLDDRRPCPEPPHRRAKEIPDRSLDGTVVGIQKVIPVILVPREVELSYPLRRQRRDQFR